MTRQKPPARLRGPAKEPAVSPKKGPTRPLRLSRTKAITKTGPKPGDPADPAGPVLIVLGYDDHGKPRAARFTGGDPDLVGKAAAAMDLAVRPVTTPDLAKAAKRLPEGHLYANGTGFVPNIRQALYSDVIVALAGVGTAERQKAYPPAVAQGLPRTWDEIAPGHVVVAQETVEYGWWVAIVIDRAGDMFTLRYRDYPDLPTFVRHKTEVAMIGRPTEPATE
jgi:hypothetical protein